MNIECFPQKALRTESQGDSAPGFRKSSMFRVNHNESLRWNQACNGGGRFILDELVESWEPGPVIPLAKAGILLFQ